MIITWTSSDWSRGFSFCYHLEIEKRIAKSSSLIQVDKRAFCPHLTILEHCVSVHIFLCSNSLISFSILDRNVHNHCSSSLQNMWVGQDLVVLLMPETPKDHETQKYLLYHQHHGMLGMLFVPFMSKQMQKN